MATSWLAGLLWLATTLSSAAADANRRVVDLVSFSIPAQALTTALDAYSRASGRELFYDGALTLDRQSNAIQGALSPDAALNDLLAGTGLSARTTGPTSVTIEPTAYGFVASSRAAARGSSDPYFASVQTAVTHALCAGEATHPGRSDLIVRMWIGSMGKVMRAQAVEPGTGVALSAYENALRGLALGVPPPTIPQPIVLAVLARQSDQPSGCGESLH
jgi:hypothetical protein